MSAPNLCRVVVVDDSPFVADTLAQILAKAQHEVRAAYGPYLALSLVETFQPDVLISDVVLWGMSGIELARRVGKRSPSCKVLLISGHSSSFEGAENRAVDGKNLFTMLPKPIRPKEILDFISNQLRLRTGSTLCDPKGAECRLNLSN